MVTAAIGLLGAMTGVRQVSHADPVAVFRRTQLGRVTVAAPILLQGAPWRYLVTRELGLALIGGARR